MIPVLGSVFQLSAAHLQGFLLYENAVKISLQRSRGGICNHLYMCETRYDWQLSQCYEKRVVSTTSHSLVYFCFTFTKLFQILQETSWAILPFLSLLK